MKKEPKYIDVLLYLYNRKKEGKEHTHYNLLRQVIYSDEIIKKYNHARRNKIVIDYMVCVYMGRLQRKNLIRSDYERYSTYHFIGYSITKQGIELLKSKDLI